jgi:hypothetical protein
MAEININNDYKIIDDNKIVEDKYEKLCNILIKHLQGIFCLVVIIFFIVNFIIYFTKK